MKSAFFGILVVMAVGLAVLFVGGQTQRVDSFKPDEIPPLEFTNAMIWINPPFADGIVQDTATLHWNRPETICPMVDVFVFDPSYDSVSIQGVTITINKTNIFHLSEAEMSNPDGLKLKFKPYDDPVAFREAHPKYSKADPRYVFYEPDPLNPRLKNPSLIGTKVDVHVDFTIMAREQSICATNIQAEFVLERHENHVSWAAMLFWKLFMPRF